MTLITCTEGCRWQKNGVCTLEEPSTSDLTSQQGKCSFYSPEK